MRVGRKAKAERVPVSLAARVTEVGTIELWCQSRTDDRRWRLQIQLRGPAGQLAAGGSVTGEESDRVVIEQSELEAAMAAIRLAFDGGPAPSGSSPAEDTGPARLVKRLEEVLDVPRDQWPPSALRACWEPLLELADRRLKSPRHESRWFNLAGFFLRPGRGFPLDELRIKALWPIFHQGVRHTKDVQCWAEWWILWRRVAAGLSRPHHEEIHRRLAPFLLPVKGTSPAKKAGRPKPEPHELAEMWRCAAALEQLRPTIKESLGDALLKESPHGRRWGVRPLVSGPAGCPRAAVRPGQYGRPQGDRRALDPGAARPVVRTRPRDRRRDFRAGPTGAGRQRPRPRPRRSAPAGGHRPADRAGRRRDAPCGRCASTTSWKRPSRFRHWATRCRSACGC